MTILLIIGPVLFQIGFYTSPGRNERYTPTVKIDNRVISPSFFNLNYTLHIADLLDDAGRAIPWIVFKLSKSLPDAFYFKWLQIIDALPKLWIESIQTDEGKSRQFCEFRPHLITNAKMYPIDKLTSRELYNFRVKKLYRAPTAQGSIQKFLNMNNLPWKDIYRLSRYISVDSFSRMFQYKVLNNILFLNSSLFAMGLCETSLCSFCQGEKETFHHLFSTCNVTTNVWQELTTFFSSKVCLPPLSLQSAVLGFLEDCQHHLFLNNILLMFKITVYRNRSKNIVTARNVLFNLKQRENIEKSIAFTNKKMDFHFTKWHFFHSLVDDTGTFQVFFVFFTCLFLYVFFVLRRFVFIGSLIKVSIYLYFLPTYKGKHSVLLYTPIHHVPYVITIGLWGYCSTRLVFSFSYLVAYQFLLVSFLIYSFSF